MFCLNYSIIEKNIAPYLTVTHLEPCIYQALTPTLYSLFSDVKKNIDGSFLCYLESVNLKPDSQIQIYCPVKSPYEQINDKKHEYKVLQRTKVLSTIHAGAYDELEAPFQALIDYAKEKKYESVLPYRVIFHKEKRKWKRRHFFKRSVGEYVVEVQLQIDTD